MKRNFITLVTRYLLLNVFLITGLNSVLAYPNGAPAGYTGSPYDNKNCTFCHGGSASTVTGWITSNIPAQGYTPGQSYTITCSSTGSGNKGFEISPHDLSGTLLGSITPGTGSKIVGAKYLTHTAAVTGGSATWTWTWTAPAAGTGSVTFYCAFVVTKPVIKLCTMTVNEFIPLNVTVTADPTVICQGSSSQLNVSVTGGTGSYTYVWTSIPPGFTSSIPNPLVTPVITTKYMVHTSDGNISSDDSTTVVVEQSPTAFAGNDTTFSAALSQIPVNGLATNYWFVQWTTSGTGSFTAPANLTGFYIPSAADKTAGAVNLVLTATPVSPCMITAFDTQHVSLSPVGSEEKKPFLSYFVSPNPTTGLFKVHFTNKTGDQTIVCITDARGAELLKNACNMENMTEIQMDMRGYPKGLYFIKVHSGALFAMQKLILQ